MLCASWSKGRQVADLRQRQKDLLAQLSATPEPPAAPVVPSTLAKMAGDSNTSELLQLRAEVNRLTRRKQELTSVLGENQRLKAQLASISTNGQANLPSDYIRKSAAKNLGYGTPQAALETFLWAVQSKDMKNFLEKQHSERDAFYEEVASLVVESEGFSEKDSEINKIIDKDVNKVMKSLGRA